MEKYKEYKANALGCGENMREYYGRLDLATSSLKTTQCSLFGDLSVSFATFPKSGMTANGRVYRLRSLASSIGEKDCMVLPTPVKSDAIILLKSSEKYQAYYRNGHQDKLLYQLQLNGLTADQAMNMYEWMMGFPQDWTKEE